MRAKHRLSAVALATLLCSIVPAATYAQDKLERFQEQLQIIDGRSLEAVTAALKVTPAMGVAAGEATLGNPADRAGIDVQLLRSLPLGTARPGLADLVEQSERTEVVVTLTGAPPDLISPGLIAEIHEGTCLDLNLNSAPLRASKEAPAGYSLAPSAFSLQSFGAILPVSFAALRSSAHAITVRADPKAGIAAFACVDVA
jgi:hypothetical protein